jgi:hypothetical protein
MRQRKERRDAALYNFRNLTKGRFMTYGPGEQDPRFGEYVERLDDTNPLLTLFAATLSERFGEEGVDPQGFVVGVEILLADMASGTSSWPSMDLPDELAACPDIVQAQLRIAAYTTMAPEAYGDDFAGEVNAFLARMDEAQA